MKRLMPWIKHPKHLFFISIPLVIVLGLISMVTAGKNLQQPPEGATPSTVQQETAETADMDKLVLRVDNLSCSGCIYTIKSSLSGMKGIGEISVDLAAGTAEVYYSPTVLIDTNLVAEAISASGYPAKILESIPADRLRKMASENAEKAVRFIASVGDWDIARKDFDTELIHAKDRYKKIYGPDLFSSEKGKLLENNLKAQILSRLMDEGIRLQEIVRSGYNVDAAAVETAFATFLEKRKMDKKAWQATLADSGYPADYFMKKFEQQVLTTQYLEDTVFKGAATEAEKQQRYSAWFANAKLMATVVYYDTKLEALLKSGSAAGACTGTTCNLPQGGPSA